MCSIHKQNNVFLYVFEPYFCDRQYRIISCEEKYLEHRHRVGALDSGRTYKINHPVFVLRYALHYNATVFFASTRYVSKTVLRIKLTKYSNGYISLILRNGDSNLRTPKKYHSHMLRKLRPGYILYSLLTWGS